MKTCDTCTNTKCVNRRSYIICCSSYKPKVLTNADRIRVMSDEELANFVASKIVNIENQKMLEQGHTPTATQLSALGATMHDILIVWLKQPAEE